MAARKHNTQLWLGLSLLSVFPAYSQFFYCAHCYVAVAPAFHSSICADYVSEQSLLQVCMWELRVRVRVLVSEVVIAFFRFLNSGAGDPHSKQIC